MILGISLLLERTSFGKSMPRTKAGFLELMNLKSEQHLSILLEASVPLMLIKGRFNISMIIQMGNTLALVS